MELQCGEGVNRVGTEGGLLSSILMLLILGYVVMRIYSHSYSLSFSLSLSIYIEYVEGI